MDERGAGARRSIPRGTRVHAFPCVRGRMVCERGRMHRGATPGALPSGGPPEPRWVGKHGGRVRGGSRRVRRPARPIARFRDFAGRHTDHVDTVIDRSPLAPRALCSRLPEWPGRNLWWDKEIGKECRRGARNEERKNRGQRTEDRGQRNEERGARRPERLSFCWRAAPVRILAHCARGQCGEERVSILIVAPMP